eukprot:6974731-Prymnesium_polylepis.1
MLVSRSRLMAEPCASVPASTPTGFLAWAAAWRNDVTEQRYGTDGTSISPYDERRSARGLNDTSAMNDTIVVSSRT